MRLFDASWKAEEDLNATLGIYLFDTRKIMEKTRKNRFVTFEQKFKNYFLKKSIF